MPGNRAGGTISAPNARSPARAGQHQEQKLAEIINLRTVKKQAARKAARVKAAENAVKFGRTRAERDLQQAQAEKSSRDHAAHERE